jgi:hypothetical protein
VDQDRVSIGGHRATTASSPDAQSVSPHAKIGKRCFLTMEVQLPPRGQQQERHRILFPVPFFALTPPRRGADPKRSRCAGPRLHRSGNMDRSAADTDHKSIRTASRARAGPHCCGGSAQSERGGDQPPARHRRRPQLDRTLRSRGHQLPPGRSRHRSHPPWATASAASRAGPAMACGTECAHSSGSCRHSK